VDGLGGQSKSGYGFGTPVTGSVIRYNSDYGAMRVEATDTDITFQFITQGGTVVDTYNLFSDCDFPLKINFQPSTSLVPEGYMLWTF